MSANPRPGADPGPGPGSGPQRQPRGPRRRLSDQDRTGLWRLGCATAAQLPDRHERPGATDAASDPATVGQLHAILEEVCPQLPWPTTGLATRHRHALRQPGLAEALAHADTDPDVIGCCDSLQRVAATVELGFRATVYRLLTCPSTSRHARSLNQALGRLGLDLTPPAPTGTRGRRRGCARSPRCWLTGARSLPASCWTPPLMMPSTPWWPARRAGRRRSNAFTSATPPCPTPACKPWTATTNRPALPTRRCWLPTCWKPPCCPDPPSVPAPPSPRPAAAPRRSHDHQAHPHV